MLEDIVKELGLLSPIGQLKDPKETVRFLEWLPDPEWYEAYVALMLIRATGMKEKFGFKGSDHSLQLTIVPGYYDEPKLKLYLVLRRLALLASESDTLFLYERHSNKVERIRVPSELVAVMLSPNLANWLKASTKTVEEFVESLKDSVFNPERADEIVRRIDVRLPSNAMRYAKTRFHQIDVDDSSLVKEIEDFLLDVLGYLPARITTRRGVHYIVDVSSFDKKRAKRWFKEFPRLLERINQDEKPRVEYKKKFQEPVPGILYKEIIPTFYPEER